MPSSRPYPAALPIQKGRTGIGWTLREDADAE
jgi:hypothetical protein